MQSKQTLLNSVSRNIVHSRRNQLQFTFVGFSDLIRAANIAAVSWRFVCVPARCFTWTKNVEATHFSINTKAFLTVPRFPNIVVRMHKSIVDAWVGPCFRYHQNTNTKPTLQQNATKTIQMSVYRPATTEQQGTPPKFRYFEKHV